MARNFLLFFFRDIGCQYFLFRRKIRSMGHRGLVGKHCPTMLAFYRTILDFFLAKRTFHDSSLLACLSNYTAHSFPSALCAHQQKMASSRQHPVAQAPFLGLARKCSLFLRGKKENWQAPSRGNATVPQGERLESKTLLPPPPVCICRNCRNGMFKRGD